MIKMTMLLKRNPKIKHEEFVQHHIEKHGPLFRQIPEAKEHVIRYIQTHPIREKSTVIQVDDFDGTAELWFDSVEGLDKVLSSDFYKEKVLPDELIFLDHSNTKVTLGYQENIIGDMSAYRSNRS